MVSLSEFILVDLQKLFLYDLIKKREQFAEFEGGFLLGLIKQSESIMQYLEIVVGV